MEQGQVDDLPGAAGVARFCGKDVPTDGINAATKTVGNLALSLMTGIGQ